MTDLFGGIGEVVSNAIGDTLMNGIQAILYATIYKLLYYLAVGFCWIVNLLYSMFEVMAGLTKVSYDGNYDYLINVFFSNSTVSNVYWGMALIGLTAGFAFAIAAVIKKLFDLSEREKRSYGQILRGLFKSFLTIICMSLIVTMVLNATTLLMQQITYVFVNADDLDKEESITYTDEEYAAMARVLNTIGNFSLNPSYNNRYNINKCFNEIRLDLQYLMNQGVFEFHYVTTDMEGNDIATWQSALQKIANAASLSHDLSMDVYHESVSNAILETMDLLKVNGSFKPLESYERHYTPSRNSLPLDRFLFLMATMRAAKNEDYNLNPSMTDPLRGAYYHGEKSIYDLDTVNEDFDIGIAALDYVILFLTCFKMLQTLATMILNCVGRIFNMLLLYLISPLIVAVSPLDDGAKFKQWTTAFIVQSLSVFGTVISMRVLLLFMPVVVDTKLIVFANPILNLLAKLVIILGAFEVSEKATNLITGILADNAGWQSITAGDMSGAAKTAVEWGKGKAMKYAGMGAGVAGGALKTGLKAAGGVGLLTGYGVYGAAKLGVAGGAALKNKISAWRNSGKDDGGGGGEQKDGGGEGGEGGEGSTGSTDKLPENNHDLGNNNNGDTGGNTDTTGTTGKTGGGGDGTGKPPANLHNIGNGGGTNITNGNGGAGTNITNGNGGGGTNTTNGNGGGTNTTNDNGGGGTNTTNGNGGGTNITNGNGGGGTNTNTQGTPPKNRNTPIRDNDIIRNTGGVPQQRTIAQGIASRVAALNDHMTNPGGQAEQPQPQEQPNEAPENPGAGADVGDPLQQQLQQIDTAANHIADGDNNLDRQQNEAVPAPVGDVGNENAQQQVGAVPAPGDGGAANVQNPHAGNAPIRDSNVVQNTGNVPEQRTISPNIADRVAALNAFMTGGQNGQPPQEGQVGAAPGNPGAGGNGQNVLPQQARQTGETGNQAGGDHGNNPQSVVNDGNNNPQPTGAPTVAQRVAEINARIANQGAPVQQPTANAEVGVGNGNNAPQRPAGSTTVAQRVAAFNEQIANRGAQPNTVNQEPIKAPPNSVRRPQNDT